MQALRQKSAEGVSVKVICDAKASPNIIQKLDPKIEVVRRFAKGLMHLKVLYYRWQRTAGLAQPI